MVSANWFLQSARELVYPAVLLCKCRLQVTLLQMPQCVCEFCYWCMLKALVLRLPGTDAVCRHKAMELGTCFRLTENNCVRKFILYALVFCVCGYYDRSMASQLTTIIQTSMVRPACSDPEL